MKTSSLPSETFCELVHSSPQRNIFSDVDVYCIPCKNCKIKYISETSRNLHVRLKRHKRDIRIGTLNNAQFQHISQSNRNFDFNSTKMFIYNKRLRRMFVATAISLNNFLNTRYQFFFIHCWIHSIIYLYKYIYIYIYIYISKCAGCYSG